MRINNKSINYSVDTVLELGNIPNSVNNDTVIVTDENQGGVFIFRPENVSINNGGTIFNGWTRQYDGAVNVKWFGAKGDGVTDDTSYFTLAGTLNTEISVPNGTYLLNSTPNLGSPISGSRNVLNISENALFTGVGQITTRTIKLSNGGEYGKATKVGAKNPWLEAERVSTENNADMVVLSTIGQIGIIGGSRTSDYPVAGSMGCIGVSGWVINDNATHVQSAYAGYFEGRRKEDAGTTHGLEIDIVNQGGVVTTDPYNFGPVEMTNGLWVASGGGEIAATSASVAIGICNNGATFQRGIVFQDNSIAGTDGLSGTGIAISFAKGHVLNWYNSNGNSTSYIYSGASSANLGAGLLLDDGRASFVNSASGAIKFAVEYSATTVNYIGTTCAVAGLPANVQAMGEDTNIDIRLSPKGNGVFAVTYGSSPATTPSSFSANRKLAFKDGNNITWYIPISTEAW